MQKRLRNMMRLKSYKIARKMIYGIQSRYMLKKGQTLQRKESVQKQIKLIYYLFGLSA
ncbi:TPA: hypothetical protein ACTZ5W_005765 [Bacillus cereus]